MESDHRGRVSLELGGRLLVMRMNLGAMARAQRILGAADFGAVAARMMATETTLPDFVTLQGLVWAALGDNEPAPTMTWVGQVIDDQATLIRVAEALGACLSTMLGGPAGMTEAAKDDGADADPNAAGASPA